MNSIKRISIIVILIALIAFAGCTGERQSGDSMQKPTYSLRTNFDEYENNDLSAALFDEILNGFSSDVWDFMVLSPDKPINDCTFLQVGAPEEIVDYQYTLEIGFESRKTGLTMYRLYIGDKDMVLRCLIDYWQEQKIPDISFWEDVSAEMR